MEKKEIEITDELLDKIEYMAKTGQGTDECLKRGFIPIPTHFYYPVPDVEEMKKRKIWSKRSSLAGLKFDKEKFYENVKEISEFANECNWPAKPEEDNPNRFYYDNNSFSYGCAAVLHSMIRKKKSKRVIEVGSGCSTKVIREAIALNKEDGIDTQYTIIDPYSGFKTEYFSYDVNIMKKPVELVDLEVFKELEENDILFIDSSHVSKLGSDVNYEILDVLPNLKKGVIVHFHDICLPYEYPEVYAVNPKFRMFWNEQYLLQAFLAFNDSFEILIPMAALFGELEDNEKFHKLYPHGAHLRMVSGGFWIRKTK